MRLFLGIDLPDQVRKHLDDLCGTLRYLRVSAIPPQNLHITLKFLGEAEEAAVPPLCEALRGLTSLEPARVWADRCELLPTRGPVRVVAAGLGGDVGKLRTLHLAVEKACEREGFAPEARQYLPHVTLARARDGLTPHVRDELPQILSKHLPGPPLQVAGFVLYESRLGGGPPKYIPLYRFGG
jgi:2'-5' RNA ligase